MKINQQQTTLYKDAIEKAKKVLLFHPNSKWADDALWLIGKSYYNMGDFLMADRRFKELVTNHPESKFADDCYFYMGLCQINMGHNDQALSAFSSLENSPKRSPYLPDVVFAKGCMEMASENYSAAEALFGEYLRKYSGDDSAASAMFNVGVCRERMKDYAGAFRAYAAVRKYDPSRTLLFDARLASASAALAGDSVRAGMQILEELANDQRYFSHSSDIHLKMAEGYYLQGEIDKAVETYENVTTQNPRTPQSAEAYYRLGLIYQNDKFDLAAAKEAFNKAQAESPNSEYRNMALSRAAQIAKLETYQLQLQRADSLVRMEQIGPAQRISPSIPDTSSRSPVESNGAVDSLRSEIVGNDSMPQKDSSKISEPTRTSSDSSTLLAAVRGDSGVPINSLLRILGGDSVAHSPNPIPRDSSSGAPNSVSITLPDSTAAREPEHSGGAAAGPPGVPDEVANSDSIRQAIIQSAVETRYLLSELYAYELNRPDSALHEYLLIAQEYPESPYASKSLLAAAEIEFGRNDTASAKAHLEELITRFPDTPQAAQAAELLQRPLEFQNNALNLYAAAESLVFEANRPDSAMALLKYIESRYPDLAPKASYMVAWILDQVLGVEDSSAYYAYSAVVKNYPETEYAAAAGDRLSAKVKEERKPTTPRERPQEPGEQPQETPDTSQQLAQGFPLAPQPKVTGQFIYPEALLSQDLRGKVIFKIKIDISGKVDEYKIIGPSGQHAIDSSATAALLQTEFDTSQLDLSQLDGYFQYSIQFKRPNINIFNDPYRQQREGRP